MKKYVLLFLSVVFAVSVLLICLNVDNAAPEIIVNSKPYVACNIDEDSLLNYITVKDDNLKSVFIEETSLLEIAESGKITYVAIDDYNNISKKQIDVDVDNNINDFYIEVINDLNHQINKKLVPSNYFSLRNKCGWEVSDTFEVKGINISNKGEYDVVVRSRKHKADDLNVTFVVDDFLAPKIVLKKDIIENYSERYYDDNFFLYYIDHVEDDHDDPDVLANRVKVNWREAMNPSANGWIDRPGTYSVTYYVSDDDGNVGKTTLKVILTKEVVDPQTAAEG